MSSKTSFILLSAALTLFLSTSKVHAQLACVSTLLSGLGTETDTDRSGEFGNGMCFKYVKPMKLVVQRKNSSWVAYSGSGNALGWRANFVKNSSGNAVARLIPQQFSDRINTAPNPDNNFNVNSMDSITLTVATGGNVVYTNHTWPSASTTLTNTSCSGNAIIASDVNNVYTITFGSVAQYYVCPF